MYKWPLNQSHFTILDRLKMSLFFLNYSKRWTMDSEVKEFEKEMAKFIGVKYAVFVSSGSTANTLIAAYLKDKCGLCKIAFPSTTWTTSISPFLREGFIPEFIDINLEDFSIDLNKLEKKLKQDKNIKIIFLTSLLGFTPDIKRLKYIEKQYKVRVLMDNCENSFGLYKEKNISS